MRDQGRVVPTSYRPPITVILALAATLMSASSTEAVGEQIAVEMGDNYYRPAVVRARAGDTIVFSNAGAQLHSPTLIDHEDVLDQAYVNPGQTLEFAVPVRLPPGEYALGCNIHVDMTAKVIVEARP